MITAPPVSDIIRVMRERSYRVFENKNGYDLTIVGINIHRSNAHSPSTLVGKKRRISERYKRRLE